MKAEVVGCHKGRYMSATLAIPGYAYGAPTLARSPVTLADLADLKKSVLWSAEDEKHLRMAGDVLADQVEEILDLWYGFVASHPHLIKYFLRYARSADCRISGCGAEVIRPMGPEHLSTTARSGLAELPTRDRSAPPSHQEESNRPCGRGHHPGPPPLPDRLYRADLGHHPRLSCEEGPLCGSGG